MWNWGFKARFMSQRFSSIVIMKLIIVSFIKYVSCPKDSVSKKTYLVSKKKLSEILRKNMRGFVGRCNAFIPAMLCHDSWERRNSTSCPIPRPCCLAPPYPPFFDPCRSTSQSWRWWWWWWRWWWQWLGFCGWQLKVIVVNGDGDDGQCWVAATYPPFFYLCGWWWWWWLGLCWW